MEWRPTSGGAAAAAAAATAAAQPQGPPPDFDIRGDLIDYRHLAHLDLEYPWRRLHSMARLSGNGGVATSGIKGRYPKLCKAVADCATTLLQPLMQADRVSAPVADDVRERVVLRLLFLLPPAAATANGGAASSDGGADGAIDDAAAVEWFSSAGGGAQRRKVRQLLQGYLDNEGLPAAAAALLI